MTTDVPGENKLLVIKALRSEQRTLTDAVENAENEQLKIAHDAGKDVVIKELRNRISTLRSKLNILTKTENGGE